MIVVAKRFSLPMALSTTRNVQCLIKMENHVRFPLATKSKVAVHRNAIAGYSNQYTFDETNPDQKVPESQELLPSPTTSVMTAVSYQHPTLVLLPSETT